MTRGENNSVYSSMVSESGWREGISPPVMDWESTNLPEAWRKLQQHSQMIFGGTLNSKKEEEQCSCLLLWVGDKGRNILNPLNISADGSKKLDSFYEHLKNHVQPKLSPVFNR